MIRQMCELSIIVPVYNAGERLNLALETISLQTFKNFECVIVDNESTDNSRTIAERWCANDSRFVCYTCEQKGVGAARNLGLSKAKGKYIGWVDADDYCEMDMFAVLVHALSKSNADIAFCDVYVENLPSNYVRSFYNKSRVLSKAQALCACSDDSFLPSWLMFKLFRRELFDGLKFENIVYEDLLISPALFLKAKKVAYVHRPLYHYMQYNNSTSRNKVPDSEVNYLSIKSRRLEYFSNSSICLRNASADLVTSMIWSLDLIFFRCAGGIPYLVSSKCNHRFKSIISPVLKFGEINLYQKGILVLARTRLRVLFPVYHKVILKLRSLIWCGKKLVQHWKR